MAQERIKKKLTIKNFIFSYTFQLYFIYFAIKNT